MNPPANVPSGAEGRGRTGEASRAKVTSPQGVSRGGCDNRSGGCRISLRSCDRALGQGNLAEALALCKAGGTRGPWGGGNGRIACDRAGMYSKPLLTSIHDTGRDTGNLSPSCQAHVQSEAILETKVGSSRHADTSTRAHIPAATLMQVKGFAPHVRARAWTRAGSECGCAWKDLTWEQRYRLCRLVLRQDSGGPQA